MAKPGQQETSLYFQVAKLTRAVESHQKAIEELTNKVILLGQNLNSSIFRMMVTERLMKEKLHITPEEIMQAGMDAIEQDRAQRAEESKKEEHQQNEPAATPESAQTGLPAEAGSLRPRLLQSIPPTLQTQ